MADELGRGQVLIGGLVGVLIGVVLVALSVFLVVRAPAGSPQVVLGGYLCVAVGMIALALASMALVPLLAGAGARGMVAAAFVGIALIGGCIAAWITWRARLPWLLGAVAPLAVIVALVKDLGRVRGQP